MKTPSYVGESAAVVMVIQFIMVSSGNSHPWAVHVMTVFGFVFILDWMLGGIADQGICKKCWP